MPETRRPTAAPITREDLEALLRAAGTRYSWRATRSRALLVVLARCGLRPGEACSQLVEDLRDAERGMVLRVSRPKGFRAGATQRELGIDAKSAAILRLWLKKRVKRETDYSRKDGRLFITWSGGPLQTSYLRSWAPRLARRAQLARRVHPHCFRATFARDLYEESVGMREIQLALGHKNLNTTAIYLASIGANEVVAVTQRREW